MENWQVYYHGTEKLRGKGLLELPFIPKECEHNSHIFYIKEKDIEERDELIRYLKKERYYERFPLRAFAQHSSKAGKQLGRFHGQDSFTTREGERLLRLPLYYGLRKIDAEYVVEKVVDFFRI